ncbi:MAG: exosortase/archaeosortase family protein [Planctomycetes bacterium]|nr:exosortase/archaeosortase family protein [Planctomycetota bacterium]
MTSIAGGSPVAFPPTAIQGQLRGLLLGGAILTAVFVWVFWHFLASQVRIGITQQADWGHTLIIPLVAGYFVYLNRHRLLETGFRTSWVGLIPVVLGVGWYTFCWLGPPTVRHHNLQGAGLSLTLFGIALLFTGFRAMTLLWFPLVYLCLFSQTISQRLMEVVTFKLQDITARGSHICLNLIGIDTDRSGNVLYVWDWNEGVSKPLNIAEACSGMRMLMAFLALGIAMAYTGFKHYWQRVVLVLMGIPVAIFVNILRVATLAILSIFDTNFVAGDFHTFIGLIWLVPAFLMFLGVMWILRHMVIEQPEAPAAGPAGERPPSS